MFELDVRTRKPIYEQLIDNIKELIVSKVLSPDEKLPSVRMLSKELTINPNTIQKAYRELEREGYLYSANRKGYFVAPIEWISNDKKLEELKRQFQALLKEAIYFGLTKEELERWFEEVQEGGEQGDTR
ncbi:GntR family transcriptional regulator [Alteribacillus bidgolensis]|uniref:GntR family transcriptional regulator n=1 Tax=Alteribacillus bidgolensis TaxID=930129 RepID=A0A1G8KZI4_9BACI|nr:GntR family transcriptional regulator [Alteribacillus bidgolensis]SDI48771.1 GntR family transcriptional regulator [Alteribacillus bidgolensis]